jgi:hypothetical protein
MSRRAGPAPGAHTEAAGRRAQAAPRDARCIDQ